jgi:hypothetical protein
VTNEPAFTRSLTRSINLPGRKNGADLFMRVYSEDELLGESGIVFNARANEIIDVAVTLHEPPEEPQISEYEQLIEGINPILQDASLLELTEEDITFLVKDTGINLERIKLLVQSARLSAQTSLPAEIFYGFVRQGLPLELEALLALSIEQLRAALLAAIEENIIPAALRPALDDLLARFKEPGAEEMRRETVLRAFVGRLLREETGMPLAGYAVRAYDLETGDPPTALGHEVTDSAQFAFVYRTPREDPAEEGEDAGERRHRLRLDILDPQDKQIHETIVAARPGQQEVEEIRVPAPTAPEPPNPSIDELASIVSLELPDALRSTLAEHNIRTLADIRSQGGLRGLEGVPDDGQARSAVRRLEAHANLGMLSPDIQLNDRLIERGYPSLAGVAGATPADFVASLRDEVGDFRAGQLHSQASAQNAFLHNLSANIRAGLANGFQLAVDDHRLGELFPRPCGCDDCEAAVSPGAYLADLLDYTIAHVRDAGQSISLAFLSNAFHQPFASLPVSCEAAQEEVRQVRLCIEVLRRYLAAQRGQDERPIAWPLTAALLVQIGPPTRSCGWLKAQLSKVARRWRTARYFQAQLGELFLQPAASPRKRWRGSSACRDDQENGSLPDRLRTPGMPELLAWRSRLPAGSLGGPGLASRSVHRAVIVSRRPVNLADLDNGCFCCRLGQAFMDSRPRPSQNLQVVVVQPGQRWVVRDDPDFYRSTASLGG